MKKIIIVSFIPPYPLSQGGNRQVIYNLLLWLKKNGYYVQFVYQSYEISDELYDFFINLVDELHPVCKIIPPRKFRDRKRLIYKIIYKIIKKIKLDKFLINKFHIRVCWEETKQVVKDLCVDGTVNAVISEYIWMADVFDVVPNKTLKLIHTHDMLSRVKKEIGDLGGDTQGREVSESYEKSKLEKCHVIIALQKVEADLFKKLMPKKMCIVLGHHCREHINKPVQLIDKNSIYFIGGNNPLNIRGLQMFCHKSWPKVLNVIPDANLRVMGPVGSSLPHGIKNSCVLGKLTDEELNIEYKKANIIINPVDLGTGLKIKTIEALSYGKALVSTVCGVEGLDERFNNISWLVASEWDDFSNKIIKLLSDDNYRKTIEKSALEYAKEYLTEEYVYKELKEILNSELLTSGKFR